MCQSRSSLSHSLQIIFAQIEEKKGHACIFQITDGITQEFRKTEKIIKFSTAEFHTITRVTLTTKPIKPCLTKTNSQEKGHSVRSMCAQTSPESITLNTRKSLKCKDLTHFLSLDKLQLTSKITSTNTMNLIKTLLRKKKIVVT